MKSRKKSKPNQKPTPPPQAGEQKTNPHPRGVFRFKTFEEFNAFKAAHHLSDRPPTK
jgi:hypothetical protein